MTSRGHPAIEVTRPAPAPATADLFQCNLEREEVAVAPVDLSSIKKDAKSVQRPLNREDSVIGSRSKTVVIGQKTKGRVKGRPIK